ncbi:MAG: aldehyde dehydrogenase family protein [Thermoplasmata archaeon]
MEKIRYGNVINGIENFDGISHDLTSPADGRYVGTVYYADRSTADEAVDHAEDAFNRIWSKTNLMDRQKLLMKLADRIQERSDVYSELETLNTGKTIRQSMLMDIPLGIDHIRYFASTKEFQPSRRITHPEFPDTEGLVEYLPVGVVGSIAPWNVPFLMAVWKIAPALLAGNTIVLKPSHYTPLTALELAKDAILSGFPPGVINVVTGSGKEVGDAIVKNPKVRFVSFTGSSATGSRLMGSSSPTIKKFTLELGGKSPNIVFADSDLDHAAKGVLFGIYLNSGQLCESGSRLILQSSIRDRFMGKLRELMQRMRAGNPAEMETDISAITNAAQQEKIIKMVDGGIGQGAKIFYRNEIAGKVPDRGIYYPPTLLTGVGDDMEIAREEIFGPVLTVMEFSTESEAVEIANRTNYGLAAGIWSKDMDKARRVASSILSGTVWINEYHLLSAAAPRGGFKNSGIGRELGIEGVMEMTETRHTFISPGKNDIDDVAYGLLFPD